MGITWTWFFPCTKWMWEFLTMQTLERILLQGWRFCVAVRRNWCEDVNTIAWQGSGESQSLENNFKNAWWVSKSPFSEQSSKNNLRRILSCQAPELSGSEILTLQSLLCALGAPRLYLALQWEVVWAGRSSGVQLVCAGGLHWWQVFIRSPQNRA